MGHLAHTRRLAMEENMKDPMGMTLDDAVAEIRNAVYAATDLFEKLEWAEKAYGNGHHARQKVSEFAADELRRRWRKT